MKTEAGKERFAILGSVVLTLVAFYIVNTSALRTHTLTIQLVLQAGVLSAMSIAIFFLAFRPQYDRMRVLLILILLVGIFMRIGYMLYTPATLRAHDFGRVDVNGATNAGHAEYIFRILNGALPDSYNYQFYHPPLYNALSAAVIWVYRALCGIADFSVLVEAAKTVSCIASILTLFYARKICRQLKLSKSATLLAMCLAAFLPNHYLLAGRVNNDALVVFFMTAILYYTLAWYQEQTWGTLIKLAFCFGLGAMSKLSALALAPVTGVVMLIVLIQKIRRRKGWAQLGQYAVFALIAFPLALWYPIRNYLRFGQPLSYVMRPPEDSLMNCSGFSLWQRFGLGSVSTHLYNRVDDDCNVWGYLGRGAVFGEFSFKIGKVIPALLLAVNLLLILGSVAAMVYILLRKRSFGWTVLACFHAINVLSYLFFNLQYAFASTMDFRYIVPTALIGALFLVKAWEELPARRLGAVFRTVTAGSVAAFGILSVVMYCNIV